MRVTDSEDFLKIKKEGVSARSGEILVAAVPGRTRRLGIIVTRKSGGATERNRIKRVVRDFFRNNQELFPAGDCAVIPGSGAGRLANDEIRQKLSRALALLAEKL